MRKGFSTLELAAIIICVAVAFHGGRSHGMVSNFTAQISYAYAQKTMFSADHYLSQVNNS